MSANSSIVASLERTMPRLYDDELAELFNLVEEELDRRGLKAPNLPASPAIPPADQSADEDDVEDELDYEPDGDTEIELSPSEVEYCDCDPPAAPDAAVDAVANAPSVDPHAAPDAVAPDPSPAAAALESAHGDAWASIDAMKAHVKASMLRAGFRDDKTNSTIAKYTGEIAPLFYGHATYARDTGAKLAEIDAPFGAPSELFKAGAQGRALDFCKKRAVADLERNGHRADAAGFASRAHRYSNTYAKGFQQLRALHRAGKAPLGPSADAIFLGTAFPDQRSPSQRSPKRARA